MTHDRVRAAIAEFRAGRMVILVDDEDRENEGDLCLAAEKITPEAINFMAKHGRGLICLALTDARIQQLGLPMMVKENTSPLGTAFTVSIEARRGVTTGISAKDRATTVLAAVAKDAGPDDLVSPGHIFPLRARDGGVLVRTGQTEGVVDLARLAGLEPAGVICEIMNDDGTMARMPELIRFAEQHGLAVVTIAELIEYRLAHETLVRCLVSREVEHPLLGRVTLCAYGTTLDQREHLVLIKGDITATPAPLVRVQVGLPSSGVLGDLFGQENELLEAAMARILEEDCGVIVCLDLGTPSERLAERIDALGRDVVGKEPKDPVQRDVGVGAQILRDLGLSHIRVLSRHPRRIAGAEGYGLTLETTDPLDVPQVPRLRAVGP